MKDEIIDQFLKAVDAPPEGFTCVCNECGGYNVRFRTDENWTPARITKVEYECQECGHIKIYDLTTEGQKV